MVRVEAVLQSWKSIREDAAQAVDDFAGEDLEFRATPDLQSFRDIAVHILQAGHCLTGVLRDGVENLATPELREILTRHQLPLPADAGADVLSRELRRSVETRCEELAGRPPEFWAGMMTRWDGEQLTRLEMLQWIKEHELTHRSQLFLYLRLRGIVPVTTRRRTAKE